MEIKYTSTFRFKNKVNVNKINIDSWKLKRLKITLFKPNILILFLKNPIFFFRTEKLFLLKVCGHVSTSAISKSFLNHIPYTFLICLLSVRSIYTHNVMTLRYSENQYFTIKFCWSYWTVDRVIFSYFPILLSICLYLCLEYSFFDWSKQLSRKVTAASVSRLLKLQISINFDLIMLGYSYLIQADS